MNNRLTITELSGRKYPVFKIRDLVPELAGNEESNDSGTSQMIKPRSTGRKFQPVRISTMHFNDPPSSRKPGSSRKDSSMTKPIRNIHKLLESPKRMVRKRLDNLYDCSKPKENAVSTIAKSQVLSSKKIAPKTPTAVATSNPRSVKKTDLNTRNDNSRQSRLLPPGTITGSYLNRRNITGARTSLFKPAGNPLPTEKNSYVKRPSDVPEETLQPLEESDKVDRVDSNNPVASEQRTDSDDSFDSGDQTSSVNNARNEKETPLRCCDCSRPIIENTSSKLLDHIDNGLENTKDIAKEDLDAKEDEKFQRPTVIVMQKEAILPLEEVADAVDESLILPIQEGSYSEILNLRPSMNSTETDESLLFKNTEATCFQSEKAGRTNLDDEMREYICKWISMNSRILATQQKHLTESIAQHEKSITGLKLMLENVNSLLQMEETLRTNFKSKGWNSLSDAESSLFLRYNDAEAPQSDAKKNRKSSSKKNKELPVENTVPEAASAESKTAKSANEEPQLGGGDVDLVKSTPNVDENKTENIENEPPTRRRSARLAMKKANLSSLADLDTPSTEQKKSKASAYKSNSSTPSMMTPARGVRWGRRSERPLREYMVLKSAIKCLNTPDSKRYRIGADGKVQIRDSLSKTDPEAVLTDKLLMELHELYATP